MGKLSEKNTFAKVLLIVALFYVVVSIILSWRYYKLVFMDMGISGFMDNVDTHHFCGCKVSSRSHHNNICILCF